MTSCKPRVVVVGGGVAGLTAAAFAARGGVEVTLLEAVSTPGGRSRTRRENGFGFNMGPHALYRSGPAARVLEELGVRPSGATPGFSGALGWCEGGLHRLPTGSASLLSTTLLGARDKLTFGAWLARLPKLDPTPWQRRSLRDFLAESFSSPRLREVFAAMVRVSSYVNAPESQSAGFAIQQLQAVLGGVLYLDGGWQSLVDALVGVARRAGVDIRAGARVRAVETQPSFQLRLRDDSRVEADAVVLALGPGEVSPLVAAGADPVLAGHAERSLPVRAACLDVGLSRLPDPKRTFALGIDEPTYLSLHSRAARELAPPGGAVLQLARYLAPDEKPDRREVLAPLERQLDAVQPGWRERVATRKLLLDLRVAHAVPTAEMGGLAGRPRVDALEASHPGLLLAGDWIGAEGWLVDGSFASGRDAGRAAAHFARRAGAPGRHGRGS